MHIVELEKLTNSRAACVAAYVGHAELTAAVDQRYPSFRYDTPALAAMDGERCAGIVAYSLDDDDALICVRFAAVAPDYRHKPVLAGLLSHLRAKFRRQAWRAIEFTYHEANPLMAHAASRLGARVVTHTAQIDIPNDGTRK